MSSLISLLWLIVAWFFLVPLSTFIHEAGHALVGLLLTKRPVTIRLGQRPSRFQFHWGRVTVAIRLPVNITGFASVDDYFSMPRKTRILFSLGGPLASLILLSASIWQALLTGGSTIAWVQPFWNGLATGAFFSFIFTVIPMKYPAWMTSYAGMKSDGYQIRELLFQRNEAPEEPNVHDE